MKFFVLARYNMSYIVQQGALHGKPVLGVSINYRLAAFGFLDSDEVRVSTLPRPFQRPIFILNRQRETQTSRFVTSGLPCAGLNRTSTLLAETQSVSPSGASQRLYPKTSPAHQDPLTFLL